MRILITGAAGSIGTALIPRLLDGGHRVFPTDIDTLDVTQPKIRVRQHVRHIHPDLIYHLAGAKYAPEGETDPGHTTQVNAIGTANILACGIPTVTASTCKACDPETVYGASKLIAERLTLNAGGWVARFYNIRESAGNVFETWAGTPDDQPLPVAPCSRFFITMRQAVDLLVDAPQYHPPGRYTVDPGDPVSMNEEAWRLYPTRSQRPIDPRRGDRILEPRHAQAETLEPLHDGLEQIVSAHDRQPVLAQAAA